MLFLLLFGLLLCAPCHASGAKQSDIIVAHGSGLMCFSITPPDAPTNKPGPHTVPQYRSCDQLCADRHAACTAATSNMNPMRSCASTDYFPGGSTLCRCCAVAQ